MKLFSDRGKQGFTSYYRRLALMTFLAAELIATLVLIIYLAITGWELREVALYLPLFTVFNIGVVILAYLHLKRFTAEQERIQRELVRKNEELKRYVQVISHDLRAPISAIELGGEALTRIIGESPSDEDREIGEEALGVILRSTNRAQELIRKLLLLAEAGQSPKETSAVDLESIVDRVLEERSHEIERKGVNVKIGSGLGKVEGDSTQMYLLFSNLIGNAIEHNTNDRPELEIARLPETASGARRFLVRDNGEGIPEDIKDKIFDPFVKGERGGYGTGLATVSRILEIYDGSISCYSDEGACFEFTIKDLEPARSPGKRWFVGLGAREYEKNETTEGPQEFLGCVLLSRQ